MATQLYRYFRVKLFIIMAETLQAGCRSTTSVPNHWSPLWSWEHACNFGNPPLLLFYELDSSNCLIHLELNVKCVFSLSDLCENNKHLKNKRAVYLGPHPPVCM